MDGNNAANNKAITDSDILNAIQILQKYKSGKANLDKRVTDDEQWYKLRSWETMDPKNRDQVEPTSAWLFNSIANKHADAMDNIPRANILPREPGDEKEAKILSSVIPTILEQAEFEKTYSDIQDAKIRYGTGIYGIFWDSSAENGIGGITISCVDIHNVFWEPGITNIQKSRNLFHVELIDTDILSEKYPEEADKLKSDGEIVQTTKYIYDDNVDCSGKTAVVDWYYKKRAETGKMVLHYVKFAGSTLLFSSENEPDVYPDGWYTHGLYPFVFDPLFSVQGTPCGIGYVDIGKSCQSYIDRMDQAILKNVLWNAKPRYFFNNSGNVSEEEFSDLRNDVIHVNGRITDETVQAVKSTPFSSMYITHMRNKIDELKETTGNRDVSTGGSAGGVTAASAIAALQEAGSKLSRNSNKSSYRAFRSVIVLVIELIRQFYDIPRFYRILGEYGTYEFIQYSNQGLIPQYQGVNAGIDMGYRAPVFDISISAEKQSAYSRLSQNELALQLYNAGVFAPQNAIPALSLLEIMDFDGKDKVMQMINRNMQMFFAQTNAPQPAQPEVEIGESITEEPDNMKRARQRVAEGASPT